MLALQLVVVDKKTGQLVVSEQPVDGSQEGVDGLLEHIREYHRVDPHMSYVSTLPIGKVVQSGNAFPREQYDQRPFHREFWSAIDTHSLIAAKVAEDERNVAMLGLVRDFGRPPHSDSDIQRLNNYIGHLVAAFRITQRLRKLYRVGAAGVALMKGSDRPVVLLDAGSRIVESNNVARDFLSSGAALYEENGKLRCCDAQTERLLWESVSQMGQGDATTASSPGNRRRAFRIDGDEISTVLCSLWALESESSINIFGVRPVALLTVAIPRMKAHEPLDPVFLNALFDLTPAEVRVATALVQGRELNDVVTAYRISIETVRSQLKSVYLKTGTHRRAQLVELLFRATTL